MKHRALLALLLALPLQAAHGSQENQTCGATWFHGTWRSNPDKSIEAFAVRGELLSGANRDRLKQMFGTHVHVIVPLAFSVLIDQPDGTTHRTESKYLVAACTSSTVTLRFTEKRDWPDLTLYRDKECYMVRSGVNFEYFCREQQ